MRVQAHRGGKCRLHGPDQGKVVIGRAKLWVDGTLVHSRTTVKGQGTPHTKTSILIQRHLDGSKLDRQPIYFRE